MSFNLNNFEEKPVEQVITDRDSGLRLPEPDLTPPKPREIHPTRVARNIVLSNTRKTDIRLGTHNHLIVKSFDDVILLSDSGSYAPTLMEPFVDVMDVVTMDDDTQEILTLQAQNLAAARVRIITW